MPNYIIGNSDLMNVWGNSSAHADAPDATKIDTGWVEIEKPNPYFMNYIHNQQEQKINHILNHGIALWNSATNYNVGDVVNYSGEIYKSLTTSLNSAPSRAGTDWAPVTPEYTSSDSSLAITFDIPTNTADYTLPAANLVNKFSNTSTIVFSTNATNITADVKHVNDSVIDSNLILTANDFTKTYQVDASVNPVIITVPASASVLNGWYVDLEIINNAKLITVSASGADLIVRDGIISTSFYFHGSTSSTLRISKRDAITGRFSLAGGSDRIGGFVNSASNTSYTSSQITTLPNARPIAISSSAGNIVDVGLIISSGVYSFSGIPPAGIPVESTGNYGWLTVYTYNEAGSNFVYQQWIDENNFKKWYRFRSASGSWNLWFSELTQVRAGGVSLNSLIGSGDYSLLGNGATDSPESAFGILTVKRITAEDASIGNIIHQEWRPSNGDILWTRYRNQAQSWTAWVKRW